MLRILACLVAFTLACLGADKPRVLKAARMFDGNKMISPGLVVVVGNKIQAVGAGAAIPAGAEVTDFGDATISPGFMDAHTHLSAESSMDYRQATINSLQRPIAEQALRASENTRKTLLDGFTTARDLGSRDFIDVGLRNAIAAGIVPGPRMLVSVHALGSTGGHCDAKAGSARGCSAGRPDPKKG